MPDFRGIGGEGANDLGGVVMRAIVDDDDFGVPAALANAGDDGSEARRRCGRPRYMPGSRCCIADRPSGCSECRRYYRSMYRMPAAGWTRSTIEPVAREHACRLTCCHSIAGMSRFGDAGRGATGMAKVLGGRRGIIGQLADAQRIISQKGLAFSCFPRHNPFMLDAEV